jgi:hypothetical protein
MKAKYNGFKSGDISEEIRELPTREITGKKKHPSKNIKNKLLFTLKMDKKTKNKLICLKNSNKKLSVKPLLQSRRKKYKKLLKLKNSLNLQL